MLFMDFPAALPVCVWLVWAVGYTAWSLRRTS